jgi:hypothetical protein
MFQATPRKVKDFAPAGQATYRLGFFPLSSSNETSTLSVETTVTSLRPLACDFRRLRFSRNASFSRSCLGSFFAGVPVRPSRLCFSSFIVSLF